MREENEFIFRKLVEIKTLKNELADTKAWLGISIYICVIELLTVSGLVFCMALK